MNRKFRPGDWVIFRKTKHSAKPGPRAQHVAPASNGDEYSYTVDKFWVVREVRTDGSLLLQTRKGKEHVLPLDLPNLHQPNFLQRWWYAARFLSVERAIQQGDSSSANSQRSPVPHDQLSAS